MSEASLSRLHFNHGATRAVRASVISASIGLALIGAWFAIHGSGRVALVVLATAQSFGVIWLIVEGWSTERKWVSATCILAAAWIPLFLVSTWVYVIVPRFLTDVAPSPEPALAILNVTLFSLIGAWLAFGGRSAVEQANSPVVLLDPQRLQQTWVLIWVATGVVGLIAFMSLTGGVMTYVTHLDQAGTRSTGLIYVVWLALFLKYVGLTRVAHYWATGDGRGRNIILFSFALVALLALFGQRAFLALMFVQAVLLYALIKRPLSIRVIAPIAIFAVVALTFGIGTIKRYQGYRDATPGRKLGFLEYVDKRASHDFVRAYTDNYADGVRLIARGHVLVPREADYEKGRAFMRLALQPIPSFVRPTVHVATPLGPLLESSGGYGYALPIPLVGYVEFGLIGVALGGAVLGAALVFTDKHLAKDRQQLARLLVLTAVVVELPFCLRSSVPRGVSFAALDLLGMWIVAKTCLRGSITEANEETHRSLSPS
jgi:hypothetical protein